MPDSPCVNTDEKGSTATAATPSAAMLMRGGVGPAGADRRDDDGQGGRPRPPFHRWVDVLPCNNRGAQQHDDGSVLKRVSLDATATWYGDEDDEDDFMDEQPADEADTEHNPHNPVDMEDTMMMLDWPADDADHMDTGVLSGLLILDEYVHNHDDNNVLMNEIFMGEVASSPLRVECCWDQLGAAAAKDEDSNIEEVGGACASSLTCLDRTRGVTRKHSSSASSTASAGSSSADDDAQLSLQELFEKRRAQLEASMEKSRESRKYLEKHIQQRASLASVLADIERSSRQIIVEVLSTSDAASSATPGGRQRDDDKEEEDGQAAGGDDEESSMVTVEV